MIATTGGGKARQRLVVTADPRAFDGLPGVTYLATSLALSEPYTPQGIGRRVHVALWEGEMPRRPLSPPLEKQP